MVTSSQVGGMHVVLLPGLVRCQAARWGANPDLLIQNWGWTQTSPPWVHSTPCTSDPRGKLAFCLLWSTQLVSRGNPFPRLISLRSRCSCLLAASLRSPLIILWDHDCFTTCQRLSLPLSLFLHLLKLFLTDLILASGVQGSLATCTPRSPSS